MGNIELPAKHQTKLKQKTKLKAATTTTTKKPPQKWLKLMSGGGTTGDNNYFLAPSYLNPKLHRQ